MRILFFSFFLIFGTITNLSAQATKLPVLKEKMVVVRSFETMTGGFANEIKARLVITEGFGSTISADLTTWVKNGITSNATFLADIFNQLSDQGYKLVSSNAGGADGYYITTYVFQKE